eukprot:TRINITY_DN38591_c0_g1_i2.p1 TRINITY_DN38591_c0_g1~~TRINITY_DN38591_c0_g1_i2.p1  ORF type:complete len:363 (-),score=57.80 TRINITY_DN38591_c0_g1_i2:254-1342(-)
MVAQSATILSSDDCGEETDKVSELRPEVALWVNEDRERAQQLRLALEAKPPLSPEGAGSSASTAIGLSDRPTPSRPHGSPDPFRNAEAEFATLQVKTSSGRGIVIGRLKYLPGQGNGLPRAPAIEEDVSITLLVIKPGYTVVSDVLSGPDILKKVCWKVRALNDVRDPEDPLCCAMGDVLVLEGPRWATTRVNGQAQPRSPQASRSSRGEMVDGAPLRAPGLRPEAECPSASRDLMLAAITPLAAPLEDGVAIGIDEEYDGGFPPRMAGLVPMRTEQLRKGSDPQDQGLLWGAPATRTVVSHPAVPRLDLHGVHGQPLPGAGGRMCAGQLLCQMPGAPLPSERKVRQASEYCQSGLLDCKTM